MDKHQVVKRQEIQEQGSNMMKRSKWSTLTASVGAIALLAAVTAFLVQETSASYAAALDDTVSSFPQKPINLVVTFPPGGGTDLLARKLAASMEQELGQTWVVENRPGASGNIGARAVATSAADGYTLLMVNSSFAVNPGVFSQLDFDPKKDFTAVANMAYVPSVLVTPTQSSIENMSKLMQQSNTEAGLHFASCGNGTPQHLAGGMLKGEGAQKLIHVPYKGCGPALADLVAGQVPLGIITLSSATPFIEDGSLRALAVTSPKRHPALPEVPSVAEALKSDYALDQWHGILAPAGTPKELVERLNQSINSVLQDATLANELKALGYTLEQQSSVQFQKEIWHDIDRFTKLTEKMGLRTN